MPVGEVSHDEQRRTRQQVSIEGTESPHERQRRYRRHQRRQWRLEQVCLQAQEIEIDEFDSTSRACGLLPTAPCESQGHGSNPRAARNRTAWRRRSSHGCKQGQRRIGRTTPTPEARRQGRDVCRRTVRASNQRPAGSANAAPSTGRIEVIMPRHNPVNSAIGTRGDSSLVSLRSPSSARQSHASVGTWFMCDAAMNTMNGATCEQRRRA